mgnify:CR=1 FL=1
MSSEQIDFMSADERRASEAFLEHGHVIVDAEDMTLLNRLRDRIAGLAAAHLNVGAPDDPDAFLNGIHERVSAGDETVTVTLGVTDCYGASDSDEMTVTFTCSGS